MDDLIARIEALEKRVAALEPPPKKPELTVATDPNCVQALANGQPCARDEYWAGQCMTCLGYAFGRPETERHNARMEAIESRFIGPHGAYRS